jgi:Tol biopolymer transport system component
LIWQDSAEHIQYDSMTWARNADLLALSYEPRDRIDGSQPINRDIHVIDTNGHHEVVIATEADETSPTWSPDATMLAYGRGSYRKSTLWVSNADGSCSVQLLDVEGVTDPTWSPDGTRIAFIYNFDLYVLDLTVETIAERMKALDCE